MEPNGVDVLQRVTGHGGDLRHARAGNRRTLESWESCQRRSETAPGGGAFGLATVAPGAIASKIQG